MNDNTMHKLHSQANETLVARLHSAILGLRSSLRDGSTAIESNAGAIPAPVDAPGGEGMTQKTLMTAETALKVLQEHNKWRRNPNDACVPCRDPKDIGYVIDFAVKTLKAEIKKQGAWVKA